MIETLRALVRQYRFSFQNERELQDGFEAMLKAEAIPHQREHQLTKQDRPDFMIGSTAIEVKAFSGLEKHLRQLKRYADHPSVTETIMVSTRPCAMPQKLGGKPCHGITVWAAFL